MKSSAVGGPPVDECLLSAIIVNSETLESGEGFAPFVAEQGFTESVATLQRHVFEQFTGATASLRLRVAGSDFAG